MKPRESEPPYTQSPSRFLWFACIALSAFAISLQGWFFRFSMNEDGMSYLDMASLAAKGRVSSLIHLYWSPLYPALIAYLFHFFNPLPEQEFPLVHFLNVGIGFGALASFTFFLRLFLDGTEVHINLNGFVAFGYALFLWSTLQTAGVGMVTPDLLVNAFVFFAAGLVLRMESRPSFPNAILFGLVLGLAAWTKAAMLPIGAALIVLLMFWNARPFPRTRALAAVAALIVVTAPLVVLTSQKAHRLTIGESGRINYAWMIQREIPLVFGWTEGSPNTGTPVHPPRILSTNPKAFEYANTTDGTYPPWYDPAFFHEGLRIRMIASNQWNTFWKHLNDLRWGHGRAFLPLFFGLVLLCWRLDFWRVIQSFRNQSWLVLWPALAIIMYALVLVQARYLSAFLVLLWLGLFLNLMTGHKRVLLGKLLLPAVAFGILVFTALAAFPLESLSDRPPDFSIAAQLRKLDLHSGEKIALIGPGFSAYFAHLDRLRIIAEVEDPNQFWAMPPTAANDLIRQLHDAGAAAVISVKGCPNNAPSPWMSLSAPGYCVRLNK